MSVIDRGISALGTGRSHVGVLSQTSITDLIDPVWVARSGAEGLVARELHMWTLAIEDFSGHALVELLGEHSEILSTSRYRRSDKAEVLARIDRALVDVEFVAPARIWAGVAAEDAAHATAVMDRLLTILPEKTDDPDRRVVPITIWTKDSEPTRRVREVESWDAIADNYSSSTRMQLETLMDPGFEAGKGGRIILLHGAPGTGKSTALAALAYQWREWSELQYVVDPSELLSNPEYLLTVALGLRSEEKHRVVLLEDAGGLFSPDAKRENGEQRLGVILNMADGMLGNGSRALWIITTNEPLESFHSAMSRPGRCAAAIEFLPMDEEEGRAWLRKRDRSDLADILQGSHTLAELYALVQGTHVVSRPMRTVGFRAGAR